MIRFARMLSLALLGMLLAGCVTTQRIPPPPPMGDASWRMAAPAGTTRYQLAMGDVSSGATPFQRVTPIYPAAQLAACPPPQEVQAQLIVDQVGKVSEVRVADEVQAAADRRPFIAAVRVAALQWQFSPLQIDHWAADADGNSHVVDSETKPFSLSYVFRFECHGGQSSVSTEASRAAHS
ncbi:hypothetical protein EAH88_13745 [Rhodanobacter glycinis]|uniref:Uncharacterized protein n=1 Tax=Rhodanobacter glycinis TaxID=582702 RepID=A0A502BZS6_9GAMM|nr:hypothetical protein [Rhodanobacter glycinis]TPG06397.1 hypothetical protein EAH88_13745 [Rhodanobacter glycinis]